MTNNASKGIGLGWILFITFLVLKLTKHIDWSWWWVSAPLWMPFFICALVAGVGGIIVEAIKRIERKNKRI